MALGELRLQTGWIELVLERAESLRKAGVLELAAGGFSVTLAPIVESPSVDPNGKPPADEVIPPALDDPHSYQDGIVPGFDIEPLDQE